MLRFIINVAEPLFLSSEWGDQWDPMLRDLFDKFEGLPSDIKRHVGKTERCITDREVRAYIAVHWAEIYIWAAGYTTDQKISAFRLKVRHEMLWGDGENGLPLGIYRYFPDLDPHSPYRVCSDAEQKAYSRVSTFPLSFAPKILIIPFSQDLGTWLVKLASRAKASRLQSGSLSFGRHAQALRQVQLLVSLNRNIPPWVFWGGLPENAIKIATRMKTIVGIQDGGTPDAFLTPRYPVWVEMRARRELFMELTDEEKETTEQRQGQMDRKSEIDL